MSAAAEQVIRRGVIYLRDWGGNIYAEIEPGTLVRHRKTGVESPCIHVEVATHLVQVAESLSTGEQNRTRWRPVDEYEVVGKPPPPPSPEAAQAELERIAARAAELSAYLSSREAPPASVAPAPPSAARPRPISPGYVEPVSVIASRVTEPELASVEPSVVPRPAPDSEPEPRARRKYTRRGDPGSFGNPTGE